MKKLFLFFFASLLSISMFAAGETGKTKAQAIPYDWNTGLHVSSEAGVGKWYVVMLKQQDGGPFKENGTTDEGLTNINVSVVNPLDEEADIDVIAYIGDNETNRHFKLAAGGIKSMTFGAGMFIKMGIDRVYLYLVMDVTITPEEAEQHEAVNVNVTPVESENTVVFNPIDFDWSGWPTQKTAGTVIPANTETWVKFDFTTPHDVANNKTYKFYIEKANATPITIQAGLSYDCPATSIQQQSAELTSASTAKILDEAKLSMLPGVLYVRIKAPQELRIYAEEVALPAPTGPAIFNINGAIEVLTGTEYKLEQGKQVYFVKRGTLKAVEEYHYKQIEVTNSGDEEVTIIGKASKNPDGNGNVWSVVSKSVTIPAHQTYVKKIDKSMQNVVGTADGDVIWAQGPLNPNITFKLTEQPNDPEFCQNAIEFNWTDGIIQNGGYQWYSVNISDAKSKKADILLTMETVNANEEANITVDLAAACEIGEPTQSYTGKSKSTQKTLSYSLFKSAGDVIYVRVKTNKAISVKAEIIDLVKYTSTGWSQTPSADKAARIEYPLTIANEETIQVLGITLAEAGTITIQKGGKLIVGAEGVKGSNAVEQIIVKEGGVLLVKDATTNNKPFVTVEKNLHFGAAESGARRPEKHEFIALPIDNREAMAGVRYYGWAYNAGWIVDGFNKAFTGYDVYQTSESANYKDDFIAKFKGQLANNKNQTLSLPGAGWHAFGNSWLDSIAISKVLANVGAAEQQVHVYVATPDEFKDVHYGNANDEKLYLPLTAAIAAELNMKKIAPMQGFFLYTESATSATLKFTDLDAFATSASPAPKRAASNHNRNASAAVVRGGNQSDFVYMIEDEDANAHKMIGNGLAIYAEDGLAQVANSNLIGTTLTLQTNDVTEYTLSFIWLKGETLYLKDLVNGNVIAMTAESTYTFTAEPNTLTERFQVIGRNEAPTAIENSEFIEGANKRIENGKIVIIKNGVKYNVLGTQL